MNQESGSTNAKGILRAQCLQTEGWEEPKALSAAASRCPQCSAVGRQGAGSRAGGRVEEQEGRQAGRLGARCCLLDLELCPTMHAYQELLILTSGGRKVFFTWISWAICKGLFLEESSMPGGKHCLCLFLQQVPILWTSPSALWKPASSSISMRRRWPLTA